MWQTSARWDLNESTNQTRSLRNSAPRRASTANLQRWREQPAAPLLRPFSHSLTEDHTDTVTMGSAESGQCAA